MADLTFRVEITRDETRAGGAVEIEITAYVDRLPETQDYSRGMLTRAGHTVWNSRLQLAGDFEELGEALKAIDERCPDATHIRCYEYTVDDEFPREAPPLMKSGGAWAPSESS
jgi:hypothetical protein